jgi:hypothetical protein
METGGYGKIEGVGGDLAENAMYCGKPSWRTTGLRFGDLT